MAMNHSSLLRPLSTQTLRSRRAFLKTVGATALGFPFLRALEFSAAHAQAGEMPLSFLGVYHPHGARSPLFRRQAGDTEDDFDITFTEPRSGAQCVLSPFDDAATYGKSFKDKIVVIDGLDLIAGDGGHDAPRQILTGSGKDNSGASLDQYLAVERGLGADTPFSSLNVGVGGGGAEPTQNLSYTSAGTTQPKIFNPTETFQTVFADLVGAEDPAQQQAAEQRRRQTQSVLDFINADVQRLQGRLAPPEARKLDLHLTSLRELEKRLAGFEGSCQVPATPPPIEKYQRYNGGEPNFNVITDLQIDMLAQAVACGITHFGTLWMEDLSAGAVTGTGITEYSDTTDIHNDVAHRYLQEKNGQDGDPSTWAYLAPQNRYSYGKCARLLQKLDQLGALDSSVILISTDMGDPAGHHSFNTPMVLAGGGGGKLRTGRYISLPVECPPDQPWCQDKVLFPHNRLLVSLANLFGAELGSFGKADEPSHAEGEFAELA